jgi:hypothetical protein
VILLAHRNGQIIQGSRFIFSSGFLLACSETVVAEFVEVHLDKKFAVFGCTTLLLLALLDVFSSFEFRATDTVTGE